jgi:hypothetical protein
MAATATVTDIPNPDSYTCGLSGSIDFERYTDGTPLSNGAINGVQFTTTGGYTWVVGDWTTGNYNGKYPTGAYTSQGERWAWLGTQQGAGRIDFASGRASAFSLLVSNTTPVQLDAYGGDGTLLATAGPDSSNSNTGHMTELKITRDAPDIAFLIVHDTGNFFLVDSICTNASGVPSTAVYNWPQFGDPYAVPPATVQNPQNWGLHTIFDYPMYHCGFGKGGTMAEVGCAITALSDVVASYGMLTLPNPSNAPTDPGAVNDFLAAVNQTTLTHDDCLIYFPGAAKALGFDFTELRSGSSSVQARVNLVDDYLLTGNLPIAGLHLNGGGMHYVVIYGKTGSGDYLIADPMNRYSLLSGYGTFAALNPEVEVLLNHHPMLGRSWAIVAHSPVAMLITDPSGRQTGWNPSTGSILTDIPDSQYGVIPGLADDSGSAPPAPDTLWFDQPNWSTGTYTIQVIGTGSGPYAIDFLFSNGQPVVTFTGTAAPNVTDTYVVTIAPDQAATVQRPPTPPSAGSPPCAPANNCFFNAPAPSTSPSPTPTPTPTPAVLPSLSISATSALGVNPPSGYSTKSLKVQTKGKYVTWKFTGGAALAGQRVTILTSTATRPGVWGPWKPLTIRVADATGSVTFWWKSAKATSVSIRAEWIGNATHGDSLSPARGVTWK